mgnify:CR=1 FL=1
MAYKKDRMTEGKYMRILTNVSEPRVSREWRERTHYHSDIIGGKGLLSDFRAALRFYRLSKHYDAVVVNSNRSGNIFVLLSSLLPSKKIPIIMIDCLWYKPDSILKLWIKRFQFMLMNAVVERFVVWASHEVNDYAEVFKIPKHKFLYIPHHHSLEGYEYEVVKGDYIFSGGDGDRDYPTLLTAVKGLGIRVVIATRRNDWHGDLEIPAYVHACPTSAKEFRSLMAGSRIVVVPMQKGLLHSGGQQTYLNAMALGKPVIVADECGASDYIDNMKNGIIVPPGDSIALRKAILSIIIDPDFENELCRNAELAYDKYSTSRCMEEILALVEDTFRATNGRES